MSSSNLKSMECASTSLCLIVGKALKLVNLGFLRFIKLQRLPTLFSKYTSFETTTCRQNKEIHWFNFCSYEDNAKKFASCQINITKIFSSFISLCEWSQKFMPIFQTIRFPNTIEILQKKIYNWAYKTF